MPISYRCQRAPLIPYIIDRCDFRPWHWYKECWIMLQNNTKTVKVVSVWMVIPYKGQTYSYRFSICLVKKTHYRFQSECCRLQYKYTFNTHQYVQLCPCCWMVHKPTTSKIQYFTINGGFTGVKIKIWAQWPKGQIWPFYNGFRLEHGLLTRFCELASA